MLFVRLANLDGVYGSNILDDRLIAHLSTKDIKVVNVLLQRSARLPAWASLIDAATQQRIAEARRSGRRIILSHEALFRIAHHGPVDALIVHNYFTHFAFRGRPLVERCYRLGSPAFYRKAFAAANSVFFISQREHRLALSDFPTLSGRSGICIVPPHPTPRVKRSDRVVHISGTKVWLPKKLSALTPEDIRQLTAAGYRIEDLDAPVTPGFALINDRFEVGFKLKLTQMLHSRDVIASRCDLHEEMESICPRNPFYRQVASVEEAIAFFQEITETHSPHEIDAYYERMEAKGFLPSWQDFATRLLDLMERPGAD